MPFQYQLSDLKANTALKTIAGTCSSTAQFLSLVNEAMRRLDRRGNFFDTEQLMRVCVYNGCITWPRFVGTVLGVKFCSCPDSVLRNNWYAMMGPRDCNYGWTGTHTIRDNGTAPTYNDITGEDGKVLRVYITAKADVGKTITFYGIDTNGQPLREKVSGVWQPGMTLTLASPYVQSTTVVKRIESVVREATQGRVYVYEYDSASDTIRDLAFYEPGETNPRYRRSFIKNFNCIPTQCGETDGVTYRSLEALVKLQFVEVVSDYDFLPIDNVDAIKLMVQAIRLEEENKDELAEVKIAKAIRELNFELRNKLPGQQSTIRINPVGRTILNPI